MSRKAGDDVEADDLETIIRAAIAKKTNYNITSTSYVKLNSAQATRGGDNDLQTLPQTITFPYSRHSSYPELCHFLSVFKPKDVWPCTVNEDEWIKHNISIASLFGKHCSGTGFEHDQKMESLKAARSEESQNQHAQEPRSTQTSDSHPRIDSSPTRYQPSQADIPSSLPSVPQTKGDEAIPSSDNRNVDQGASRRFVSPLRESQPAALPPEQTTTTSTPQNPEVIDLSKSSPPPQRSDSLGTTPQQPSKSAAERKRPFEDYHDAEHQRSDREDGEEEDTGEDSQQTDKSFVSTLSTHHSLARREAYYRMLEEGGKDDWEGFSLLSTDGHHTNKEKEL